ncbi:MAG: hypothetical protein JW754_02965 [Candidatus Aenigmarchaeota archaeon]|nr:hypothetical protein [Candidatus Aenigmarchaeota archaeon]
MNRTIGITSASVLAAVSIIFQIVHIGYLTPWGMWIDLVAIPWILAYFIFGFRTSVLTACVSAVLIALLAPSGYIGASMKLLATIPMIIGPALVLLFSRKKLKDFEKMRWLLIALALSLVIRGAFVLPVNYFIAIPLFFGMETSQALAFIPPWLMFLLNAVQGVIDMTVAWTLAFRFKMTRFGK